MASTLAYRTSSDGTSEVRNDLKTELRFVEPEVAAYEDPWGVVCCLGQDGIVSTSSCNVIAARSTGEWCPWCHPGDDVPISAAFD